MIRATRVVVLFNIDNVVSTMNRVFGNYKNIAFIIVVLLINLSILAILWITYIPSFNLKTIRNTLAHKSDVASIASYVMVEQFPNESMPPPNVEIELVYEYTPTCIVTLTTLMGRISQRREILVFEINQSDQWVQTQGLNITFEPENGFLPTRPAYLTCS